MFSFSLFSVSPSVLKVILVPSSLQIGMLDFVTSVSWHCSFLVYCSFVLRKIISLLLRIKDPFFYQDFK